MYPGSGRILILQRSSGSWGNSATAYFALRAAAVRESSLNDILGPSAWLPGGELEDWQGPFHERDNPLPVEVRDDGRCRQPLLRQTHQRVGEALELGLLRWGRHPPIPLRRSLPEHPVGERRERAPVVPKVEPPSTPPGVRPPARANRLGWPRAFSTKSSPRNRWIHRSQ